MAAEERKSFLLRVDPALWAEISAWASDELRSVNGQVEFILRQAVQQRRRGRGALPGPSAGASTEGPAPPQSPGRPDPAPRA